MQAAAAEAAMVADWCRDAGIAHATLHPQGAVRGNVQSWARAQRYALLEEWRAARGLDWLLTAHHADDQLETLLKIGRASWRERVCQDVSISVVAGYLTKKIKKTK